MEISTNESNKKKLAYKILKHLKVKLGDNWAPPDRDNFKVMVLQAGEDYDFNKVTLIEKEMNGLVSFKTFNTELWVYLKIFDEEEEEEKQALSKIIPPSKNGIGSCVVSFLFCIVAFVIFLMAGFMTGSDVHFIELVNADVSFGELIKKYSYLRTVWIIVTHAITRTLFQ